MKKNNFYLLVAILIILLASACTTSKTTTSTVKTMNTYGAGVIQLPVVVELDVSQEKHKVTIEVTGTEKFAKDQALVKALKETDADVLIEPTYEVQSSGMNRTVTLQGYPAHYRNFRTIEQGDVELLDTGILQKANVIQTSGSEHVTNEGDSRKALSIVGAVAAAVVLVTILIL